MSNENLEPRPGWKHLGTDNGKPLFVRRGHRDVYWSDMLSCWCTKHGGGRYATAQDAMEYAEMQIELAPRPVVGNADEHAARWHATYNAALAGALAYGCSARGAGMMAAVCANEAHGPIEGKVSP